jgi:MFS family permease
LLLSALDNSQDKSENYNEIPASLESEAFGLDSVKILKELNSMFWLISIICITLYGAVLPFNYIASGFLTSTVFADVRDKQLAQEKAGIYMSIPFFISAFMVPLYGTVIDKFGQRAYLTLISSVVGLGSFAMFFYLPAAYALVLLGMTYSMFASVIWPAISLVVKKSQVVN